MGREGLYKGGVREGVYLALLGRGGGAAAGGGGGGVGVTAKGVLTETQQLFPPAQEKEVPGLTLEMGKGRLIPP